MDTDSIEKPIIARRWEQSPLRMLTLLATLIFFFCVAVSLIVPAIAQDIDTLRSGVVKITAKAEGKSKTGTGFVVHHTPDRSLIVTASHVIEGDQSPQVEFYTLPNVPLKARIVENDRKNDIALLEVSAGKQTPPAVNVLPLASIREIKDNEELTAIGFPRGGGPWAAVRLILSSRNGTGLTLSGHVDEGSSGSPVLKNGSIVGMITSASSFSRAVHADIVRFALEGWRVPLFDQQAKNTASVISQSSSQQPVTATTVPAHPHETRLPFEPEMARIPPGKFLMGASATDEFSLDSEHPQHEVMINYAFEIGKYEVTFDEYDAFAEDTSRKLPSDRGWGRGKQPVINVSWYDAQDYVKWLSDKTGKRYRLPTEAEWEYAAKAGTQTQYWWGDDIGRNNANCNGCGSQWDGKQTAPVGSFKSNAFGLYDTAGNVWEWAQDCAHDNYTNAPADGSAWLEKDGGACNRRVVRGGWWDDMSFNLRSVTRYWVSTGIAIDIIGFRIARDL